MKSHLRGNFSDIADVYVALGLTDGWKIQQEQEQGERSEFQS